MLRNLFTIVIVPRRTAKVKKIHIPLVFGLFVILIIAGMIFGWSFVLRDYLTLRQRLQNYDTLTAEHKQRQERIETMSERLTGVEDHFDTLSALNHKLKRMMMQSGDEADTDDLAKNEVNEKLETAESEGITAIIASDSSEIDAELKYEQEIKFENLLKFFATQQNPYTRIPDKLPTKGYIVQKFGTSFDPYTGESRPQMGIDITTHNYQPILAPADGIVMSTAIDETFGKMLVIDHGNGLTTRYGHISKYEVAEGDIISRGETVALTGNTGHTTGPRIRYEVLFNQVPINPVLFAAKN